MTGLKRLPVWARIVLGVVLVAGTATCGLGYYTGLFGPNIREVAALKCYRSGQPKPAFLKKLIDEKKLRCVINLRGDSRAGWYDDEIRVCEEAKIEHVDINIAMGRLANPGELQKLVVQLEKGPYPMLIHCKNGSDRAGMASVFYRLVVDKQPLNEALKSQLTWRYGHVNAGEAADIDRFFELYKSTGNGLDLKTWLKDVYPAKYKELEPGELAQNNSHLETAQKK